MSWMRVEFLPSNVPIKAKEGPSESQTKPLKMSYKYAKPKYGQNSRFIYIF